MRLTWLAIVPAAFLALSFEAHGEDVLKTLRKGGNTYSSPVGIGDKVYFFDDTGLCTVIRNSPDYEVFAKNALDELVQTSPAISDGALYVRGERHLWKIGSSPK